MAKIVCKGTIIQHNPGGGLVSVANVMSIDHSGAENETYDATDLSTSGSGKEYANTGYTEGGSISMELFYDPALVTMQTLLDDLTTPVERAWSITFSDTTVAAFNVAGMGFGFTVDMAEGLKGTLDLKLDQLFTYPT